MDGALFFSRIAAILSSSFRPSADPTFRFKIRRSPVFGEIGLPQGGPATRIPATLRPLVKYAGVQLSEPELLFSNKDGSGVVRSPHPIRGIVENRPYDYPLTRRGFLGSLRVGVVCPASEARTLTAYLGNVNAMHAPQPTERDYLVDYPGFHTAYGLPIEVPEPGDAGWFICPEPSSSDLRANTLELAGHINRGVEALAIVIRAACRPGLLPDTLGWVPRLPHGSRALRCARFRQGVLRSARHRHASS